MEWELQALYCLLFLLFSVGFQFLLGLRGSLVFYFLLLAFLRNQGD